MGAVGLRIGHELRRNVRAWIPVALMIGLAAGTAIAAATGARRTETAYPRFLAAVRAPDIVTGGATDTEEAWVRGVAELETLPQVAEFADGYGLPGEITTPSGRSLSFPQLVAEGDPNGRLGVTFDRLKLLRGRLPLPDAPDEATVSFAAEARDLTIGTTVSIAADVNSEVVSRGHATFRVRIVGVHAAAGEFPSVNGISFSGLALGPGVIRAHADILRTMAQSDVRTVAFRLKRGAADVPAFRAEAARRHIAVDLPVETAEASVGVQKTMRFQADALWLLCGLLGVAAFAIFGQAIMRLALNEAVDHPALRALGMTRRQLFTVGMARAAAISVAATTLAVPVAVACSALTPLGTARIAEPLPGIRFDPLGLVIGAAITFGGVLLAAVWPSLRAARLPRGAIGAAEFEAARPSRAAATLTRAGAPVPVVAGVRFALEPGRGRTGVPVKSATLGIVVGVAALVMALTFRSSLDVLIKSPGLSGYTWDLLVAGGDGGPKTVAALRRDPAVADATLGGAVNISIAGARMLGFTWQPGTSIGPVILAGRAPRTAEEIALGGTTMRKAGLKIGDRVTVVPADQDPSAPPRSARYTVVGRAIISQLFFEPHGPGEGAAFTLGAYARLLPGPFDATQIPALVRYHRTTDLDGEIKRLRAGNFVAARQQRADVGTLEHLSATPVILAGLIAAMAAGALIHTLVTTIRRRSKDLAILRTLGFVRSQLRSTILIQSAAVALVACAAGVPAGVAAGRWGWRVFADQIAVVPHPSVAPGTLALVAPATLVLAFLVALAPARRAGHTGPAQVLRTE